MLNDVLMKVRMNDLENFDQKMRKMEKEKEEEIFTLGFETSTMMYENRVKNLIVETPQPEEVKKEVQKVAPTQDGAELLKKFLDTIKG
jgi:endonuclease IV